MICRFDNQPLSEVFIDLVNSPAANSFLKEEQLNEPEKFFPLKLYVSERTYLVQIEEYKNAGDIFNAEYVYFSSFSSTWLEHARKYVEMIIEKISLDKNSFIVEIASNDGYLLKNFVKRKIPCLGIEPTSNTAKAALNVGVESITKFFGLNLAKELFSKGKQADLIIGNNVFAHVPDINDFVSGLKTLLKPQGTINLEFPHLLKLIEESQFDTIYHEHFWYFSLYALQSVFPKHGLEIYDVEELNTHGGSLRLYVKHINDSSKAIAPAVKELYQREISYGVNDLSYYKRFSHKVNKVKIDLLQFLIDCKRENKTVAAYGAAAKGNTLLNYCGIKNDMIDFVVDASPHKQNKYLPGSHIPVVSEEYLIKRKPDFVLILPWNLQHEIVDQLSYVRKWNCKFITPIPNLKVIE